MMKSRPRFSVLLLGISATSALRLPATTLPRTNCAASTRHDAALAVLTASAIAIFSCQAPPACAWDGLPTSALLAVVCDDRGRCTQPTGASANLQRAAQSAQSAAGKIKQEADNGQRISQARATKMQALRGCLHACCMRRSRATSVPALLTPRSVALVLC